MIDSDKTKFNEMIEFMKSQTSDFKKWYVGITDDAKRRLEEHKVKNGYIYRIFSNETVARDIEKYFIDNLKTDGGDGGGNNPKIVYAYIKTNYTNQ